MRKILLCGNPNLPLATGGSRLPVLQISRSSVSRSLCCGQCSSMSTLCEPCLFAVHQPFLKRAAQRRCVRHANWVYRGAPAPTGTGRSSRDLRAKATQRHSQAISNAAAVALSVLTLWGATPATASIPIGEFMQRNQPQIDPALQLQAVPRSAQLGRASSSTPLTPAPGGVAAQAQDALKRLQLAREASDAGQYQQALDQYNGLVHSYPDLALTEYARLGRALMLYQVGRVDEAVVELESEAVSLTGYAEVHAALAALLYAERPQQGLRAEQEWDVATAFDSHYSNTAWVVQQKHWPPRLVDALDRFLQLR